MSSKEKYEAPQPPRIPSHEEQFKNPAELGIVHGHESSEDPQEGRFVDHDPDCKE